MMQCFVSIFSVCCSSRRWRSKFLRGCSHTGEARGPGRCWRDQRCRWGKQSHPKNRHWKWIHQLQEYIQNQQQASKD